MNETRAHASKDAISEDNALFGIEMCDGNHLRKINQSDTLFFGDDQIKLVKVAVDKAVVCKSNHDLHQSIEHVSGMSEVFHLRASHMKEWGKK
jgi:hypothetical protein